MDRAWHTCFLNLNTDFWKCSSSRSGGRSEVGWTPDRVARNIDISKKKLFIRSLQSTYVPIDK